MGSPGKQSVPAGQCRVRPRCGRGHRRVQGVRAAAAAHRVRAQRPRGAHARDALRFVGEATWAALSGEPVSAEVWDDVHEVPHVRLGQTADLVFVAPATADLLARAAAGASSDLLTAVLLTARCPVVFAPAMHTEMWEHPATQANVCRAPRPRGGGARSRGRPSHRRRHRARDGCRSPPSSSAVALRALARGAEGLGARPGRAAGAGLRGRHQGGARSGPVPRQLVLRAAGVRAGPGGRGAAARRSRWWRRTWRWTIPRAPRSCASPRPCEMRDAVMSAAAEADAVVMAAAVADYRPETRSEEKIKKSGDGPGAAPPGAEPGHPARAVRPPGAARPGHRRVRRRDRGRARERPGASSRTRAVTCWS